MLFSREDEKDQIVKAGNVGCRGTRETRLHVGAGVERKFAKKAMVESEPSKRDKVHLARAKVQQSNELGNLYAYLASLAVVERHDNCNVIAWLELNKANCASKFPPSAAG